MLSACEIFTRYAQLSCDAKGSRKMNGNANAMIALSYHRPIRTKAALIRRCAPLLLSVCAFYLMSCVQL